MAHQTSGFYGRESELALVRAMVKRPEQQGVPTSRHIPALVFTGPSGSGKTALLKNLADKCRNRIPVAAFDCQQLQDHLDGLPDGHAKNGVVPEMLAVLAFQLSRPCPGYGTIDFPRLIIGQLALETKVATDAWDQACKQVDGAVRQYRNIGDPPEFLREVSGALTTMMPMVGGIPVVEPIGRRIPDLLYNVANRVHRRRRGAHDGLRWYGSQDRGLLLDPLNELVELNHQRHQPAANGSGDAVGHALFGAFLADIREGFATGRHADARTLNSVILLDNVDTRPGHEFLSRLLDTRSHRSQDLGFDPVTIVATSRRPLSELSPRFGGDPIPVTGDLSAKAVDHAQRGQEVLSLQLSALQFTDVSNMITQLGPKVIGDRGAATPIYEFTGGHAAASCMLRDAIGELQFAKVRLVDLLDSPLVTESDPQPRAVGHRLLDILLPGVPPDVIKELVTASAARDQDEAARMADGSDLMPETRNRHDIVFARNIWSDVDDDARFQMPPLLRRLLLRRLADRGNAVRRQVHTWLYESCQRTKDEVGELYHLLAVDPSGLEPVANRLAERFAELETTEWHTMLKAICLAPNTIETEGSPAERIGVLTGWCYQRAVRTEESAETDLLNAIARLVAALWLSADPLHQVSGDLHGEIYADYVQLARRAATADGRRTLLAEADKYK